MAPRSAAALLKTVKRNPATRRSGNMWTTGVTVVIAMGVLALVGMEFTILNSHTSKRQAIMQKRAAVNTLKSLSSDDDMSKAFVAGSRSSGRAAPSSFLKSQKGQDLLPPPVDYGQPLGRVDGDTALGQDEEQQQEEEEALEDMGLVAADEVPQSTEPPIVQPNSGLRQHTQHVAAAAAYSVVSHRERVQEPAESGFTFSGDIAEEHAYKLPDGGDSRSRANDAVAKAKEKAAAIRARARGGRKFGQ